MPVLTVVAVLLASCGAFEESEPLPTATPANANVVRNGGFEAGPEGWEPDAALATVDVAQARVRAGERSLRLSLGEAPDVAVRQALTAPAMPEYISGFFFVDGWGPDGGQHIELLVRVRGADFGDGYEVHELRMPIGGTVTPLPLPTIGYAFLDRDAPARGRWVYFGYPVTTGFQAEFGRVPAAWDALELVLAVRRDAEGGSAQVHFDELYAGPLRFNPNRPDAD